MKLSLIEKILIVATIAMLISVFGNKHSSPSDSKPPLTKQIEENPKVANLGLNVSEFRQAYEELVASYSAISARIRKTYTSSKNGKNQTCFYIGDTVAIELETDTAETSIQRITVFCEPAKGTAEKNVLERATVAYILVMEILTPDLTPEERNSIVHKLSSDLENYSVVEGNIKYKTRLYNGILMLSADPN